MLKVTIILVLAALPSIVSAQGGGAVTSGGGGTWGVWIFLLILAIWSASAVYFFRAKLWRRGVPRDFGTTLPPLSESLRAHETDGTLETIGDTNLVTNYPLDTMSTTTMQGNTQSILPGANVAAVKATSLSQSTNGIVDIIAAEAERNRVVISEEGMKLIAERARHDAGAAVALVGTLIKSAESRFSRDDGWLLLNKEKITAALTPNADASIPPTARKPVEQRGGFSSVSLERERGLDAGIITPPLQMSFAAQPAREVHEPVRQTVPVAARRETPAPAVAASLATRTSVDSALFVSWIATGDKVRPVQHIKTLRDLGTADAFLKRVVLELDVVYRARLGEVEEPIDERLMHTVSGLGNPELERLISVLLATVDQSYHSPLVGIKIALLRAAEVGRG